MLKLGIIFLTLVSCTSNSDQQSNDPTLSASHQALSLSPLAKGRQRSQHERVAKDFIISSAGAGASAAGQRMYELGGNIYDAFAAVSFAISVERPQSTGLGGGGFAMIFDPRLKHAISAIDFRERAPLDANEDLFLDEKKNVIAGKSTHTIFAVGTPGLVAGVLEVHARHGKLTRQQILEPAIELAEKGFKVEHTLAEALQEEKGNLRRYPSSAAIFLHKDGTPYKEGEILIQKDLATTLRLIAREGSKVFYEGIIRDQILAENQKWKGLLTKRDFSTYRVKSRNNVAHGTYREFDIYSMPPPSSGGTHVIQILNTLEPLNLSRLGPQHPRSIHMTAAAMQQAFADRATFLGDADFVKVPVRGLTSKKYAAAVLKSIPPEKARPSSAVKAGQVFSYESSQTTHFSIADKSGAMISSTQTINGYFGSGIVASGSGILLNNEMDDFSAKPGASNYFGAIGGSANKIEPGKRPLSSMSPTLVLKKGKPFMAVGTPSGTRIISCVTLTLLNVLEYNLPLYGAVAAVRYHHQWQPDEIQVDTPGLPSAGEKALQNMGYKVKTEDLDCEIYAVMFEDSKKLRGISDPRSEGMSSGI